MIAGPWKKRKGELAWSRADVNKKEVAVIYTLVEEPEDLSISYNWTILVYIKNRITRDFPRGYAFSLGEAQNQADQILLNNNWVLAKTTKHFDKIKIMI